MSAPLFRLVWQFRKTDGPLAGLIVHASYPCFNCRPTRHHWRALIEDPHTLSVHIIPEPKRL